MSRAEKRISFSSMLGLDSKNKSHSDEGSSSVSPKEEPVIVRAGLLKKVRGHNQFKPKYFVLLDETANEPAKLVYYDSEKKFLSKSPPKRQIILEKCLNINRKQDSTDKTGKKILIITIFTVSDCVQICFDDEDELNGWFEPLLHRQQRRQGNSYGKKPQPTFEYMWQVNVRSFRPEDNSNNGIIPTGPHRLCVTEEMILLYPLGEDRYIELPHVCTRNILYKVKEKMFGFEIGRTSPSGSGLLSLDCEEREDYEQLKEVLRTVMENTNVTSNDIFQGGPKNNHRPRSSSFSHDKATKSRHSMSSGKLREKERDPRNRTISEPVAEGGKPGHVTPEPYLGPRRPISVRCSPGIRPPFSPTSPVGSVSTVLSDDGTGSSNSINDPSGSDFLCNGLPDQVDSTLHNYAAPEAIPEESSGEVSIEFKAKDSQKGDSEPATQSQHGAAHAHGHQSGAHLHTHQPIFGSLPRQKQNSAAHIVHKKQPSLPDYMPMNTMVTVPQPARNTHIHLSTSLPTGGQFRSSTPQTITSPGSNNHYHVMTGFTSSQKTSSSPVSFPAQSNSANYLPMDIASPAKSSSDYLTMEISPQQASSDYLPMDHVSQAPSTTSRRQQQQPHSAGSSTTQSPPASFHSTSILQQLVSAGSLSPSLALVTSPAMYAVPPTGAAHQSTTTITTTAISTSSSRSGGGAGGLILKPASPVEANRWARPRQFLPGGGGGIMSSSSEGEAVAVAAKVRIPSGEAGYVEMSPGVSCIGTPRGGSVVEGSHWRSPPATTPYLASDDLHPTSRAAIEEALGGRWQSSPRHSSPVVRRNSQHYGSASHQRSQQGSQRNSTCLDDNEALWEDWRFGEDPDNPDEFAGTHNSIPAHHQPLHGLGLASVSGRSPVSGVGPPSEDYMVINYPRTLGSTGSLPRSILSPGSSANLTAGTPTSEANPRLNDLNERPEKAFSFLRTDDDDPEETEGGGGRGTSGERLAARPPRDAKRTPVAQFGSKFMDIPSSKSSSRSNISPFGRTPPSGSSGSPTVVGRIEGFLRNRAGSVPNRPPIFDRRRHRTQSEGEKENAGPIAELTPT